MNYFACFSWLSEDLFLVGDQKVRSAAQNRSDKLPFSLKYRILIHTDGWKRRMAEPKFVGLFQGRRKQFSKVLVQAHDIQRKHFVDPPFLRQMASLVEEDVSRAVVVLASDILAARGSERGAWVSVTSYMTLIEAPPADLDLERLKLDLEATGDFPQIGIQLRGQTKMKGETEHFLDVEKEFRETPWISLQKMFGFVFALCTGFFQISVQPAEMPPRAFLDTRSLLDDGSFRAAVEMGAGTKLGKKIAASDEFPNPVRQYLARMGFLQPATRQPKRGRPPTIRRAWMRRARANGWGWKEFRSFYLYKSLSESDKAALDEDIRSICKEERDFAKPTIGKA